jgi:ribosomal protein S27AE
MEPKASSDSSLSTKKKLDNFLKCSFSMMPFEEPYVLSPCGHTFDKKSIESWTQGNSKKKARCPECGAIVLGKIKNISIKKMADYWFKRTEVINENNNNNIVENKKKKTKTMEDIELFEKVTNKKPKIERDICEKCGEGHHTRDHELRESILEDHKDLIGKKQYKKLLVSQNS